MAITKVQIPSGEIVKVEHPDGATDEQILSFAQQNYKSQSPPVGEQRGGGAGGAAQAGLQGFAKGATFNFADEIQAGIGAGIGVAADIAYGNKPSLSRSYNEALTSTRGRQEQLAQGQPVATVIGELGGAIGIGVGGTKLALKSLPELAGKARGVYAAASPLAKKALLAAAGATTGQASGDLYAFGAGEGGVAQREQAREDVGYLAGAAGAVAPFAAPLIGKAATKVGGVAKSAVSNVFGKKAVEVIETVAGGVTSAQKLPAEIPTSSPLPSVAEDIASNRISLPTGVKSGDVELMRVEEAARQGLLGIKEQAVIQQIDKNTFLDAQKLIKKIAGVPADAIITGTQLSDDYLESGVEMVKNRYNAEKRLQNALMKQRNEAIASSSVYADYTKETLGNNLAILRKTPDYQIALQQADNAGIKQDFDFLDKMLMTEGIKSVKLPVLAAWRKGLNRYQAGTQAGVLSKGLASTYDGWLDNLTNEAIKNGDDDLVNKITTANQAYSKFKGIYGDNKYKGKTSLIKDIVEKTELTPDHLANMVFGKGLSGGTKGLQKFNEAMAAVGVRKQDVFKQSAKAGLLSRVLETKNGTIGEIKGNLDKLLMNKTFTKAIATPEDVIVIKQLNKDLGAFIAANSRKDVYAPSAPALLRALQPLLGTIGNIAPPLRGVTAMFTENVIDKAAQFPAKRAFEKSLSEYSEELAKVARENPVYFGSRMGAAVAGGSIAGQPQEELQPYMEQSQNTMPQPSKEETAPAAQPISAPETTPQLRQPLQPQSSVSRDLLNKIVKAESAGNPNAKAKTSSASGLFQFTNGTWAQMVRKYGKEANISFKDKNDVRSQWYMAEKLTQENESLLNRKIGRQPTGGELYIAHFLGADKASKLINKKDANVVAALVFPKEAKANKPIFFHINGKPRTVAEVYNVLTRKVS
jgi:hypothetical protein